MRSKKLLSLLLAFCMILGLVAPAGAVTAGSNTVIANQQNQQTTDSGSQPEQGEGFTAVLPSKEDVLNGSAVKGSQDGNIQAGPILVNNNRWTVTPVEGSGVGFNAEVPDHIRELREAGLTYDASDRVSAFVLLDSDALIATYSSFADVPLSEVEMIELQQETVIMMIEEDVLDGEELQVDSQLSFLTNGIAITTEFGNLEEIAQLTGVKSVFLMPVYYPCETERDASAFTIPSGETSGVPGVWESTGFTGAGMTISIIDTGLDLDHPSFAADPADPKFDEEYIAGKIDQLNAYENYSGLTASKVYRSAKVPFAFNYGANNLKADHDGVDNDHGTHVAGIAAANAVEGTSVVGMAPDAQVIVMKVFNSDGGANASAIVEALEDSLILGVDVVNMSLGSSGGFSAAGQDWIDGVYEAIASTNVVVNIAAGNEDVSSDGNIWGTGKNPTSAPDNATIASPSTYVNVNSIASIDNAIVQSNALNLGGTNYAYTDGLGLQVTMNDIFTNGQEIEYLVLPGIGAEEEYWNYDFMDVYGKVVVVNRGEISFVDKLMYAEWSGAAGLIVINADDTTFLMSFLDEETGEPSYNVSGNVPAIMVGKNAGDVLRAMADENGFGTFTYSAGVVDLVSPNGGQMSDFSSWGVAPDLRLVPDLSGIGGDVLSTVENGKYAYMSGTSMASPQVAGISALVMQYLRSLGDPALATSDVLDALLMSTAVPAISNTSRVEASPRQQGAGLVNALYAVTSGAYITVDGTTNDGRPKAELGDDANGSYSFTFTIHNFSDTAKTYTLGSSLLTEAVDESYKAALGEYFMAGYDCELPGTVTFSCGNSVTVGAGSTADVIVTIQVGAEGKEFFADYYPNGGYVEGFIYLEADNSGVDMSLPFLGFYGDWTAAPIFDTAYWYEKSFWENEITSIDGNMYWHVPFISLGATTTDWFLGISPYTDVELDENGNIIYDEANNVISPNGDGLIDGISELYLSMMRGAKELHIQYIDAETDEVYMDCCAGDDPEMYSYCINVTKTMYLSSYGGIVPFIHSWYSSVEDFVDANGDPLPDGTTVNVVITAVLDYDGANDTQTLSFPVTIDTTAPQLVGSVTSVEEDGKVYLSFLMKDANPCFVQVTNPAGTQIVAEVTEFTPVDGQEDVYSVKVDITGWGNELMLSLCDYGVNESYFQVALDVDNMPEYDADALYAYRVYDASYEYGDESFYGWVTVDTEYGVLEQVTNDQYEYYAVLAAEYVDGKIFAADAGLNFLVIQPGTFFRTEIRKLDMEVYDMAWDETTDTMYVVGDMIVNYGDYEERTRSFGTIDLLTGELTIINDEFDYGEIEYEDYIDYIHEEPLALAVDGTGTIYAVAANAPYLYTIDPVTGAMTRVAQLPAPDEWSDPIKPSNAQSMTYSEKDNCIYWAYYYEVMFGMGMSALYKITPADESTPVSMELIVDNGYNCVELVGLLTMEDTEYTIPASNAASELILSEEKMSIAGGSSKKLSVKCMPWNFDMTSAEVVWTSSAPDVATVDEYGTVVGHSNGTATITVQCGDASASCEVTAIVPVGSINGLSYADSVWFNLDLTTMEYEAIQNSPVQLISAEYDARNRVVYGYDANNYFYRLDIDSNETTLLGIAPVRILDMTYDYSTGLMYGIEADEKSTLYQIDLATGDLVEVGRIQDDYGYDVYFLTLACSTEGSILYGINADGEFCTLAYDEAYGYVTKTVIASDLPKPQYVQSMCYDHNTGYIVWAYNDMSTIILVDPDTGKYVDLGNTYGKFFNFFGLTSVPEEIPELGQFAVEELVAEDMLLYVDASKTPKVTVKPLNATVRTVTWESADPDIVCVNGDGTITGVGVGNTTLTATLVDTAADPAVTHTVTITVTVKESADNLYGYVMANLADYSSYYWVEIDPTDPTGNTITAGTTEYYIYGAEYVDTTGLVYGYGIDNLSEDWTVNYQFIIFNPATFEIVEMTDMGEGFPFVYDMTYDYTTGTMYVLAGYTDNSADLFIADLESGALIQVQTLDRFFQSIVADENGTIYAISNSVYEDLGMESVLVESSKLYTLDPLAGTCTELFDLGIENNAACSAAYDYDTNCIYWAQTLKIGYTGLQAELYMIDVESEECYSMGPIDTVGAQMSGLFFRCEEYPEAPDSLYNIVFSAPNQTAKLGETLELRVVTQPMGYDFVGQWSSSDESVVTVDENGVVTTEGVGSAVITVTVEDNGNVLTAQCEIIVFGSGEYLLTYNNTMGGFATIDRLDHSYVRLLSYDEGVSVRAIEMVDGVIYAYDEEGNYFVTSPEADFERTYLGGHGIEFENPLAYVLIRDMEWDPVDERMLVLAADYAYEDWLGDYNEQYGSNKVYEMDLATGALTEIVAFPNDVWGVVGLTVTDSGEVYYYRVTDDTFGIVDLETGMITSAASLQSQAVYCDDYNNPKAISYDSMTNCIYMLFLQMGQSAYSVVRYDLNSGKIYVEEHIGEVLEENGWFMGDMYAGMVAVANTELHFWSAWVEDGDYHTRSCECGMVEYEPHDYQNVDGSVCSECGAVYTAPLLPDIVIPVEPGTGTGTGSGSGSGSTETPGTVTDVTGDGVEGTTVVNENGKVVSAEAEIPADVAQDAMENDVPVVLPIEAVPVPSVSFLAPEITITTNCDVEVPVEIPVINPTPGTVVVIVNKDGTETVIPTSTVTEDGVVADLPDGATVKVIDNAKSFDDVDSGDWFSDAVAFVSARGILGGTGAGEFGGAQTTSRAMVWTMLARLSGVDTTGGENWYAVAQEWAIANGVSDGSNPNGSITREQLVTMLYRFIGEPETDGSLNGFTDGSKVSDWSAAASAWAVENSVMNGSNGALNPQGITTRAQLAQFIMNFINAI